MNRLERRLNKFYRPTPAPWKRPVLLLLSLLILGGCAAAVALVPSIPPGLWFVLAIFAVLGLGGLVVALFGSDFWVALLLGSA